MAVPRDTLLAWLDSELEIAAWRDYGPNGLQVIGAEEVERVAVAVSSSLDVFERAGAEGAQLLVVHHGLFWDGASPVVARPRPAPAGDAVPARHHARGLPPAARRAPAFWATTRG